MFKCCGRSTINKKMAVANKDSWSRKPMPEAHGVMNFTTKYTEKEFEKISCGVIPEAMEDKWFMYVENDTLYVHRSWTGFCIYQVDFVKESDKYLSKEAVVNRDSEQYHASDDEYEAKMLAFLIDAFFLHKGLPMP